MNGNLILEKNMFGRDERRIMTYADMEVSTFMYSTGVEAVKLKNNRGYIIMLPFQGQQIWDAVWDGKSIRMQNFFDEPVKSELLLDSYGAFLFHCGALRMGCPAPEDDHPLHGELPGAAYQEASVLFGEDEKGAFIGITGSFKYTKAFGDKYEAVPAAKIHQDDAVADISMTVRNLASYPMDLMYMCHVNFLPVDNGELIQPTGWSTDDMKIRSSIPAHVKPTKKFLEFMDELKDKPEATRILRPEDEYNPEIVFYINNLRKDENDMTHMLQKHTDGSAEYISYNPEVLNHTVRWILKNDDQKVIGMALPSTCDPEGYTAEKAKGNVRTLEAGAEFTFRVSAGHLDSEKTGKIEKLINTI